MRRKQRSGGAKIREGRNEEEEGKIIDESTTGKGKRIALNGEKKGKKREGKEKGREGKKRKIGYGFVIEIYARKLVHSK